MPSGGDYTPQSPSEKVIGSLGRGILYLHLQLFFGGAQNYSSFGGAETDAVHWQSAWS